MQGDNIQPSTVDEYIAQFPEDVRQILAQLRALIKELAPAATERMAYGMPGYYLNGPLVYFAGFQHHIGFYPIPSGVEAFKEELAAYKSAKGSVQFPLGKPMPFDLIGRIVSYRLAENLAKADAKAY